MSKYIKDTLEADFQTTFSGTYNIKWNGVNFDPTGLSIYLAPSLTPLETINRHLGTNNQVQDSMLFTVHIVIPKGSGVNAITNLNETLRAKYYQKRIGEVVTYIPETLNIVEENEWLSGGIVVEVRHYSSL